jgi:hypothetical protein
VLFDRFGDVFLRHPDPERFIGRNVADTELFKKVQAGREGWTEAPGLSGVQRIFAFTPIGLAYAPDLYVLAGFSREYVFGGVNGCCGQLDWPDRHRPGCLGRGLADMS